jgi:transcription factor E2F3
LNEIDEEDHEKDLIIQDINKLEKEEEQLDTWIETMKTNFEKLTDDSEFKNYGYVTFEDIKSLTYSENMNLIAIKAPPGTSLDIPDPDMIHDIYIRTKEVKNY